MNYKKNRAPKNGSKKPRRRGEFRRGNRTERRNGRPQPTHVPASDRPIEKITPMSPIEMEGVFDRLIPEIQHALSATGYSSPTAIQTHAIPELLAEKDVLGSAQTGTGKTAAFTLPLLQKLFSSKLRAKSRHPQALILAPTRELAVQIGDSLRTYGRFLNVTHTVIYGGVGQGPQERAMNQGVDIVIATPGRLLDLMNQGFVKLNAITTFVLDEADRMLDMGFIPDINRIVAQLPQKRQTAFFSATLGHKVISLANTMLAQPVHITLNPQQPTVDNIHQQVLFVDHNDKVDLLTSILREPEVERAIVFAQMKHVANRLCERLQRSGINAAPIHGDRSQAARTRALVGFRTGKVKVLVATDVASRGIDVDGISHVINYDLPIEAQTYIHRIGRTARAGSHGRALSFCTAQDRGMLKDIERLINKPVPTHVDHDFHSHAAFKSASARSRPFKVRRRRRTTKRPFLSTYT